MANSRVPGPVGGSGGVVEIDDGTMCRYASSAPGPVGLTSSHAADLSVGDKLVEAAKRATPLLPQEMQAEFASLFSPSAIAVTAGVLTAWAASHLIGVGEAADIVVLLVGIGTIGWQAVGAARDLWNYVVIASEAKSDADLNLAASHLAHAVAVIGVTAFISLIMKGAGKGLKVVREGKVAGTEIWWEAEVDPALADHPGTAIPQGFKLKVGGRTFYIKSNATKHMAERARANASLGAYAGRVEFPISSLAAALEQAEARGDLAPLLSRKVARLGTPAQPFRVDEWELSIELVNGQLEVLHAVYKP